MYFIVFNTDKAGKAKTRDELRPSHRDYLRRTDQHGVTMLSGGPTLGPDATTMNGTLLVVEAESLEQVESFVAGDPYSKADMFESVVIRPWAWSFGQPVE